MTDVEDILRATFRDHERGVRVDAHLLDGAVQRAGQRVRRQRVALAVSAAVVAIGSLLTVVATVGGDERRVTTAADRVLHDVAAVDDLPIGSDEIITRTLGDGSGVFLLRDDDGAVIALSSRSPKQGCRIVLAETVELDLNPSIVFHDPCHGANFDREGRVVGGPSPRGMYRYDVTVVDGRIVVDTAMAQPGPFIAGIEGGEMSLDRLGVIDDESSRWFDTLGAAGDQLRDDQPHPFVWVLGSFHDLDRDVVSVAFTIDGNPGELQIGPSGTWPHAGVGQPAGPEVTTHELEAGTLVITEIDDGRVLNGAMDLDDGRQLRFGLLLPRGSDSTVIDHLARLIDLAARA